MSANDLFPQTDTVQTNVPALKDVYAKDFKIGCLLSYAHVGFPDDPYVPGQSTVVAPHGGELVKFHMNSMSPGNNMKPAYTIDIAASAAAYNAAPEADKDSMNTHPIVRFNGNLIAQLDWAKRQNFTFRGHTLVWHNQTPDAFFRSGYAYGAAFLTREKLTARLDNYIKEVIRLIHEDWPELLSAMDVVNEAVNDDGTDRMSTWYSIFGDNSYIMTAFELTDKWISFYGENQIKLYYNDYNTHNPDKADGIVRVCSPIYQAGYLDGIGMQDHDGIPYPTAEEWIASYNKFELVCDEMAVTELDVATGSADPDSSLLATQANQYAQLFKCFVERSYLSGRGKIISVSKDGLNDEFTFKVNQASSLWDANYQCKPAFYDVVEVGSSYNALDTLIAYAGGLQENNFTPESWLKLQATLTSATAAMARSYSIYESAAEALTSAKDQLVAAIDGLVKKTDLEAMRPVIVEADSGNNGSDFFVLQDGAISYVAIQTDMVNSGNPGDSMRIITYQVTFPDTGSYNLFARLRVGPNTYNDDSFFYGNGFGIKIPDNDSDWIMVNGMQDAGFSNPDNVVNDPGGLHEGIWKWVNLSKNQYQGETGITFSVKLDSLDRIFQIGGRENGLDIDKLAFGRTDLYYTVCNLDNREPGSEELPGDVWDGPPLASGQTKFVGCAYGPNQAPNFESYWNQVTPENASKWGAVEVIRDVMNWGALDAAYNFAKENGFPFAFHVLIWGNQQPGWMEDLADAPDQQLQEITEWFQAVAERYPDIDYLQVVNEPLHDPPTAGSGNYIEALGGSGETGWDWVLNAFRMARSIFPDSTKLMINDYNILSSISATADYLELIRLLQSEDLIDGIGVQGHTFSLSVSATIMRANLDSLATTGLPIQVTEMDINNSDDTAQLQTYQRVFPTLYEHPGVEGITLWGWRPGTWQTYAYLLDQGGNERPALQWMRTYLDTVELPLSIQPPEEIARDFKLYNNYPNPFNPLTRIAYSVPQRSYISLKVYNTLGQEVATLYEGIRLPGEYQVTFNAKGLASGFYLYQLKTKNAIVTRKMILLK